MLNQDKIKTKKIILIILLGLLVYSNAFFVPFLWDDSALITHNPLIKEFRSLPQLFLNSFSIKKAGSNFYRPLQTLSNWLDYQLGKDFAFGFHLTNIILHISCAIALYYLFSRLFKKEAIAFFSAILFLIHPINVEAVTYISGRADCLVLLFLLLSFISYVKFRQLQIKRFFYSAAFFYALALFSKEVALAGIFVFILLDWAMDKNFKFKYYFLFAALSAAYLMVRLFIFLGAGIAGSEFSPGVRILTFFNNIFSYFRILIFPVNLHMSYTSLPLTAVSGLLLLRLGFVIALIFCLYRILKNEKKIFFFCLIWFFIFLIPQSGILPINAFFAEHFIYLSEYGLFFIFVSALWRLFAKRKKILFYVLCPIIVISLCISTFNYNRVWADPVRFYRRIISLSPRSFMAYNNLGYELEKQGLIGQARYHYFKAFSLNPKCALAYYNFGRTYRLAGDSSLFNHEYEKAFIKAKVFMPREVSVYFELALLYRMRGRSEAAEEELRQAIGIEPKNSVLHLILGLLYKEKGNLDAAIEEYLLALKFDASLAAAYNNLGTLFAQRGDYKKALFYLSQALSLDNDYYEARFNLGLLYLELDMASPAREEFLKIPGYAPTFPLAQKQIEKIEEIH